MRVHDFAVYSCDSAPAPKTDTLTTPGPPPVSASAAVIPPSASESAVEAHHDRQWNVLLSCKPLQPYGGAGSELVRLDWFGRILFVKSVYELSQVITVAYDCRKRRIRLPIPHSFPAPHRNLDEGVKSCLF